MQVHPLIHFSNHLRRSLPVYNPVQHTDGTFVITISKMQVRRIVIPPIQADNDSKKSANLRHMQVYIGRQIYKKTGKRANFFPVFPEKSIPSRPVRQRSIARSVAFLHQRAGAASPARQRYCATIAPVNPLGMKAKPRLPESRKIRTSAPVGMMLRLTMPFSVAYGRNTDGTAHRCHTPAMRLR